MKGARIAIGVISIILFIIVMFQSCAAGVAEAIGDDKKSTASGAGIILAFVFLAAGILSICLRGGKMSAFVLGAVYILAGIIAIAFRGFYGDLIIWGSVSIVFGVLNIIFGLVMKKAVTE